MRIRSNKYSGVISASLSIIAVLLCEALLHTVLQSDSEYLGEIIFIISFAVGLAVFRVAEKKAEFNEADKTEYIRDRGKLFRCALGVCAVAALLGGNFIWGYFKGGSSITIEPSVFAVVSSVFLHSIAEEYLCRYLFLSAIYDKGEGDAYLAVLLQALFFAVWHGISALPFTLYSGIVLGLASLYSYGGSPTRSSFVLCACVHGAYNLIICIMMWL